MRETAKALRLTTTAKTELYPQVYRSTIQNLSILGGIFPKTRKRGFQIMLPSDVIIAVEHIRASENFQGCLPQSSLKKLGQILTPLAILGHFERFSPGPNGSEVGCLARLFKVI